MADRTQFSPDNNNRFALRIGVTVVAVLLFVLIFSLFYETVGVNIAIVGLLPSILAGLLLGIPAGGLTGLSVAGINILLFRLVANYVWSSAVNENLRSGLLFLIFGIVAGVIHYMVTHFVLVRVNKETA